MKLPFASILLFVLLFSLMGCETIKKAVPSGLKEKAIELFRNAPLVFETEIGGKPVRIVLREKKDGTTEQVAVTEDGETLDETEVKAAVAGQNPK